MPPQASIKGEDPNAERQVVIHEGALEHNHEGRLAFREKAELLETEQSLRDLLLPKGDRNGIANSDRRKPWWR
jgi:hypothetical protein